MSSSCGRHWNIEVINQFIPWNYYYLSNIKHTFISIFIYFNHTCISDIIWLQINTIRLCNCFKLNNDTVYFNAYYLDVIQIWWCYLHMRFERLHNPTFLCWIIFMVLIIVLLIFYYHKEAFPSLPKTEGYIMYHNTGVVVSYHSVKVYAFIHKITLDILILNCSLPLFMP